ncbi:MAG: hypothetical protein JWQ76_5384 [Ramlibacter sp.]|nr:hypothetical protein [Ramlibacter sp.]
MILITAQGRLAHQPELKVGGKTPFCEFRLLSTRFAAGEEHVEAASFFCFGEMAERFCESTMKGQLVSATGTQQTQRWTPPEGPERTVVRYRLTWWQAGPRPNRTRLAARADSAEAAVGAVGMAHQGSGQGPPSSAPR